MQRAKLNAAWIWARVGCPPAVLLALLEVLEVPEPPEDPHAASASAIPAAATRFAPGHLVITAAIGTPPHITRP
jgi:hypothetical protein